MFGDPMPLLEGAQVNGFTPDSTLLWIVAYAGPCVDCGEEKHTQLYMMPVIGWLHVTGDAGIELRPAIMNTAGVTKDYLAVPSEFKFIAVLFSDDDTAVKAKEIYRRRFGGEAPEILHVETIAN